MDKYLITMNQPWEDDMDDVGMGSISLINFSESCWLYQLQIYIRNCKGLNVLEYTFRVDVL